MKWNQKALVLLILVALIGIPPLGVGYANLWLAKTAIDASDASVHYETAAKFLFWTVDLYEQAGLLAQNDPQRTIQLLLTARKIGSLSSSGQVALGDAYLANKQIDQARTEWEDLLYQNQELVKISPRLIQIYHNRKEFKQEENLLNIWLGIEPSNPDANERLGRLLAALAAPDALTYLNMAASSSTDTATRLNTLISALKSPTENPAYRLARCGQALAQLGEWTLAEQAFTRAVNTDPQYANAWAWLGLARQQNNMPAAQAALEQGLKLDQNSAAIHAMLGTYWQQAGKPEQARQQFKTATDLEPGNPSWWVALGAASAQLDLSEALNAYTQAVNLAPQEAGNWYALAAFCVENEAYIEDYGLSAALRAFALDPTNPTYMDMLGRAQMATGQREAAEVMFKKALAVDGSTDQAYIYHFHLGLLYMQSGQSNKAKFEFQQTLESDPQGTYGSQAKKLVERYFP